MYSYITRCRVMGWRPVVFFTCLYVEEASAWHKLPVSYSVDDMSTSRICSVLIAFIKKINLALMHMYEINFDPSRP